MSDRKLETDRAIELADAIDLAVDAWVNKYCGSFEFSNETTKYKSIDGALVGEMILGTSISLGYYVALARRMGIPETTIAELKRAGSKHGEHSPGVAELPVIGPHGDH